MTASNDHPLDGCFVKIQRALKQVNELQRELDQLLPNYSVEHWNDTMRRRLAFRVVGPRLPIEISVLTGEIIHHLRSVFDHVAWAFAKDVTKKETSIKFPVEKTSNDFERTVRNGAIDGMPAAARALVADLQPYRSAPASSSLLKQLHDLDIADKHREPLVTTQVMIMGDQLTLSGETFADFAIVLADPPGDGFFTAEENGELVRWLNYESEREQPHLRLANNTKIEFALRVSGEGRPVPLIPQLLAMAEFSSAALREFAQLL